MEVFKYMSENILITGSSGFVGSHLSNKLKEKNNVVGIVRDLLPSRWLTEALKDVTLVQGDIRESRLVRRVIGHYDIDKVYHIAAAASVKQAHKNPKEAFQSNIIGTVNVLEACRQLGDKKVLILNTDKVYGERLNAIETDPYQASEPYATSKCCQGFIAQTYAKTYGMDIKMAHSVNIFGYDPFNSRLIPNVVKDCIRNKKPVIFTNDKSIREYVYIDDVVDALVLLMDSAYKGIFHIHTGWVFNQMEIIFKIADNFNIEPEYRQGNIPFQIQEETLSSVNWDWKPSITFEEALKKTIERFIQYRDDWDKKEV